MTATAASLLSARAVRERCRIIYERGLEGRLTHFSIDLDRLPAAAAFVAETTQRTYPDLRVPPHSRWRHFVVDAVDRWADVAAGAAPGSDERARMRFDLAVTSVLLDAGAGPSWRWHDPVSGRMLARSEGLAIASLGAFQHGLFSSVPGEPRRADAESLQKITAERLGQAFQVAPDNPLAGLDGRAALMRRLGEVMANDRATFGSPPRIGNLFDRIVEPARDGSVLAIAVLNVLLNALGPIWPDRLIVDGCTLGDTWRHPAIEIGGATHGLVPFHKLSQWLAYSLIEPLEEAGYRVVDPDGLTGLAEYRNGGLFLDFGVIAARNPELATHAMGPAEEPIVEWRALTVALLDEIAPLVRKLLARTASELPLASILQGGTWSAGRRIASQRRADGSPPLTIISDGSIF